MATMTSDPTKPARRMTSRQFLIDLAARNRDLIDAEDRDEFTDRLIEEAPAYIVREMVRESLNLNWNILFKPPKERKPIAPKVDVVAKAEAIVKKVAEVAAEKAITNFLGQETALGKPLGECTGEEVGRLSGWHKKIAAGMKPNQKVKNVYTETQLMRFLLA